MDRDEHFMRAALKEAKKAFDREEVPVGAVVVLNDQVIGRGYNQVEMLKDASAHAEMIAMGAAAQSVENWRLLETTLYCTLEPCVMCAGAMHLFRVKRIVWGAPDLRHGANGSFINLFDEKHPMHEIEVSSGILKEEAAHLMQEFFAICRKRTS